MQPLASEVLEAQFGSTELHILFQNKHDRIITSTASATGIVLELSWVTFKATADVHETHQAVLNGVSMGKAFRESNIAFERITLSSAVVPVPSLLVGILGSDAATAIEVQICVGPDKQPYAHILELYNVAVQWPIRDKNRSTIIKLVHAFEQKARQLELR